MSYTYHELTERLLERMDIYELIEVLELTSEELVDRFEDKIMKDFDKLEDYLYDN
jgi:hypothetical protein